MRIIAWFIAPAIITGCAHTHIAAWEGDRVKVCGNGWASRADFEKLARGHCGGSFRHIGGSTENTGNATIVNYGYGPIVQQQTQGCSLYQCIGEPLKASDSTSESGTCELKETSPGEWKMGC